MPVYKNEKNGTWYAMIRYKDWTGTNKQKCQRGFLTRKEAVEWEAQFKLQQASDIDMTFPIMHLKSCTGAGYVKESCLHLPRLILISKSQRLGSISLIRGCTERML